MLLLFCSASYAQSHYGGFTSIGKRDGMFHTNTKDIYEDSKGFVWFATTDGLMRFDGVRFSTFRKSKADTTGLSSNCISCILEDKFSYIFWLGNTLGGIDRFDVEKNTVEHFYIPPDRKNDGAVVPITALYQVSDSLILVGTQNQGLYYFSPSNQQFSKIAEKTFEKYFQPKHIYTIKKREDCVWVCSSIGILKLNLQGKLLKVLYFRDDAIETEPSPGNMPVYELYANDSLWITFTANNKVFRYNQQTHQTEKIVEITDEDAAIRHIEKDSQNGFWLGALNKGLYFYNQEDSTLTHYYSERSNRSEIPNNHITSLLCSKNQDIVWIGTNRGVSKYNYNDIKFKPFEFDYLVDDPVNNTFFLAKDSKGGYWFRNKKNLYRKRKGEIKFLKFTQESIDVLYGATEDTLGNLWFATKNGLYKYDLNTDKGQLFILQNGGYINQSENDLNYFLPSDDSHVWVLSASGLVYFNLYTQEYTFYYFDEKKDRFSQNRFTSMDFSPDKKSIWISVRSGALIKFDIVSKAYELYNLQELSSYFSHNMILVDIEFADEDHIWMATYGEGLLNYNIKTQKVSNELAVGMLENYAYGMLKDDNNNIWVSSNMGIACVNVDTHKQIEYDSSDGVLCDEFNDNSYFETQDGKFLFGGINGFIEFDPLNIYHNTYNAPIQISSVEVNCDGGTNSKTLYPAHNNLEFNEVPKEIKIYVSVLDFSHPDRNSYRWRLKGYDNEWRESEITDPIILSNLPGKNYVLELVGINNDGYQMPGVQHYYIKVASAFVDTIYFRIIALLCVVLIIYLVVRLRLKWYQKQEHLLTEKVHYKTKELKDAYADLEVSREEVYSQKAELEIHRNYLEDLVLERTKDLECAKLKAEESDRLKTAFLANLSHEIRTPMNAIIGFSSLLMTDDFEEEQRKEFVKVVHQSSESLLVLINDIIDISRIETGNIRIVEQQFLLSELIKETLDELVFEEKSEEVHFRQFYELAEEDEWIYTDRHRLKQIVSNLLRNAFKFTEEGYVHLTIKSCTAASVFEKGFDIEPNPKTKRVLLIEVSDSGIGMNDEQLKIIFEPFRKVQTQLKFYKGMGLGLSIVKNLLHFMGGDIKVKSKISEGTTFTFYLDIDKTES